MPDPCDTMQQKLVKLHLTHRPVADDPEVKAHLDTCPTCRLYRDHLEHDERALTGYAMSLDIYVDNVKDKLHRNIARTEPCGFKRTAFPWWAVAAVVPLIAVLVLVFGRGDDPVAEGPGRGLVSAPDRSPGLRIPDPKARAVEAELALAKQHLAQGNAAALLELLRSDYDETRVRAAQYLAQVGDERTLGTLNRLARTWSDMTVMNPYAQAIAQIEHRLLEPEVEALEPEVQPEPTPVAEAASVGHNINPDTNGVRLEVVVTEKATGQPLSGVTVSTFASNGEEQNGLTHESGICRVGYEESQREWAVVWIQKEGYVPMRVSVPNLVRDSSSYRVAFVMHPATVIGGIVLDVDGAPIVGATVSFHYEEQEVQSEPYIAVEFSATTDDHGKWMCVRMPAEIKRLDVRASHPAYAETVVSAVNPMSSIPDRDRLNALRDKTLVMTLHFGQSVAGYILDGQRSPVSGAAVENRHQEGVRSDEYGRFEIQHISPEENGVNIVVIAEGFPPVARYLSPKAPGQLHEVVLRPGWSCRGRIVDLDGDPLTDARVSATVDGNTRLPEWQAQTDANGIYELSNLSGTINELSLFKPGYMRDSMDAVPDEAMADKVLFPVLNVTGNVVDAESGHPIEEFEVIRGSYYRHDDSMHWEVNPSNIEMGRNGELQYRFMSMHEGYALLIEAEGYTPVRSRTLYPGESDVALQFALVKGDGLEGQVLDHDGRPVARVSIFAGFPNNTVVLRDGVTSHEKLYRTQTDAQGRFVLNPRPGVQHVVAVADGGMGSVPFSVFKDSGVIVLEPWASVEGALFIGSQPAPGINLAAMMPDEIINSRGYWGDSTSVTDERGYFHFPKIPPGPMVLYHHEYRVESGQHLRLRLGGEGRTVTGQCHLAGTAGWEPFRFDILSLDKGVSMAEPKPWHSARMDNSGRFRHDNLAAGRYALCGFYTPRWIEAPLHQQSRLWHEFTVPPLADKQQLDVPLPLGEIALIPGNLEVGAPAPAFDLNDVNGQSLRSSDYAGRWMLLSFYRLEECADPSLSLVDLETIHRQVGQDNRFVLLGLVSHDPDTRIELDGLALVGLPWSQVVVGPLEENRTHIEYDVLRVDTWPWNVLVGPDGEVLAVGLEGEELMATIEANLP